MTFIKRDQWSEDEIASLPKGEHDYFDRKAGAMFDGTDRNAVYDTLAKAASAFANSGGGHLVLGVTDDGDFDGVPRLISGRTSTRDWLEQKLPDLLDYRLNDFRVHEVVRAENSTIPEGRELVVVDFADSPLAPHQSRRHTGYFYRSAGRSIPAPHFYLELLRQRLTSASLEFEINSGAIDGGWEHDGSLIVRIVLGFAIKNVGRIAAYKWSLVPVRYSSAFPEGRQDDIYFGNIPGAKGRATSIRTDDTILPECTLIETLLFGVRLRPLSRSAEAVLDDAKAMLSPLILGLRLATETSPGELKEVAVGPSLPIEQCAVVLKEWISGVADPAATPG